MNPDINYVFRIIFDDDGNTTHRLSGKYLEHNGELHVLEDHDGFLSKLPDGPILDVVRHALDHLKNSSYLRVVNYDDWMQGAHPDLVQTGDVSSDAPPEPRVNSGRTSRFSYHDESGTPQFLFSRGNSVLLGDKVLDDMAIKKIHDSLNDGTAHLDYLPEEQEMQKMEELIKGIDPSLKAAMGQLRQAVKAGHMHPDALKTLNREMFKDTMIPTLGNKKAYADMLSRPREGVHIVGDSNRFKQINDTFGHHVGDQAIKAFGTAWREALDESVGRKHGKAYRIGGDEFAAHVPSHEHAAKFARTLRQKLEAIHPVGGTHKYSMSLGFGHTPEHADKALYQAKAQKPAQGDIEHVYAHSLIPGSEGPVPVNRVETGLTPPIK